MLGIVCGTTVEIPTREGLVTLTCRRQAWHLEEHSDRGARWQVEKPQRQRRKPRTRS